MVLIKTDSTSILCTLPYYDTSTFFMEIANADDRGEGSSATHAGLPDTAPSSSHIADHGRVELGRSRSGRRRYANSNYGRPDVQKLQQDFPSLFTVASQELRPIQENRIETRENPQPTRKLSPTPLPASALSSNLTWFQTPQDTHGLFRAYPTAPTHIPGADSLDDVSDGAQISRASKNPYSSNGRAGIADDSTRSGPDMNVHNSSTPASHEDFSPFANQTISRTVQWYGNLPGGVLRPDQFDNYVKTVLQDDGFRPSDYPQDFKLANELKRLDTFEIPTHKGKMPTFHADAGWKEASVTLKLPCAGKRIKPTPTFDVKGLHRRSIVEIIRAEFGNATDRNDFHLTPYKLIWDVADHQPELPHERVITELYNCDAMVNEHIKIRAKQVADGDDMETVVAGIMLWSDSTHLADFGTASLWPAYMGFGNQSKYTRSDPRTHSLHHLAYIPEVLSIDSLLPLVSALTHMIFRYLAPR